MNASRSLPHNDPIFDEPHWVLHGGDDNLDPVPPEPDSITLTTEDMAKVYCLLWQLRDEIAMLTKRAKSRGMTGREWFELGRAQRIHLELFGALGMTDRALERAHSISERVMVR